MTLSWKSVSDLEGGLVQLQPEVCVLLLIHSRDRPIFAGLLVTFMI